MSINFENHPYWSAKGQRLVIFAGHRYPYLQGAALYTNKSPSLAAFPLLAAYIIVIPIGHLFHTFQVSV